MDIFDFFHACYAEFNLNIQKDAFDFGSLDRHKKAALLQLPYFFKSDGSYKPN